ncbi:MAG TPA: GAF domain-containing protein [Thermomicrobiales bacterium]|nr:GAF domain-containing protein [Thermomicrobiales bacterium]
MADDALQQANALIARQAAEIERLREQISGEQIAGELRHWLTHVATAGAISAPDAHNRLLDTILASAATVIGAHSGAIFLVDVANEELTFGAALGPKADEVRRLRVPLGHGIAGLVAVSGQPMAISDASNDPRQAADIAETVGYMPQSILCVPVFYDEQVIGVLELLDKQGGASFSPDDMNQLSLFAGQAAAAIEQARGQRDLTALLNGALRTWAAGGTPAPVGTDRVEQFTLDLERDATYARSLNLAGLVNDIASHGDLATEACSVILRGFLDYLRAAPSETPEMSDISFNFGGGR